MGLDGKTRVPGLKQVGEKSGGSAPPSLYTGSGPGFRFEVQQACGSAGDREMSGWRMDGTDQKSGAGVKAVWRRSSDAFWSSSCAW